MSSIYIHFSAVVSHIIAIFVKIFSSSNAEHNVTQQVERHEKWNLPVGAKNKSDSSSQ